MVHGMHYTQLTNTNFQQHDLLSLSTVSIDSLQQPNAGKSWHGLGPAAEWGPQTQQTSCQHDHAACCSLLAYVDVSRRTDRTTADAT